MSEHNVVDDVGCQGAARTSGGTRHEHDRAGTCRQARVDHARLTTRPSHLPVFFFLDAYLACLPILLATSDPALGRPHSLSHTLQSLWSGYALARYETPREAPQIIKVLLGTC
jgi:hypothetical protein